MLSTLFSSTPTNLENKQELDITTFDSKKAKTAFALSWDRDTLQVGEHRVPARFFLHQAIVGASSPSSPLITTAVTGKKKSSQQRKGARNGIVPTNVQLHFPVPSAVQTLNRSFSIVQSINIGTISSSTTISTYSAQAFTASQLDQISSLTNVFDQYRFVIIEVTFTPRANMSTTGLNFGDFHTVIDVMMILTCLRLPRY